MLLFNARDISKVKHHRSHHWDIFKGVPMLADACRPGIGGEPLRPIDGPPHVQPSLYPPYVGPLIPPWLAYDMKVLCFHAYFKETLHEVYQAPYQVRKVRILFYLEDGTVQVSEPRVDNSGLSQGCVVSRQRVPRPAPCHHEFLSILDLNVNQTVTIFDRVYQITGCDLFTRHFLNRTGISVPDPIETPLDPGQTARARSSMSSLPRKPTVRVDTLGQFLANDRKVLRFNAYWDDREAQFGDVRDLIVYYFLADDTIQLKEVFPRNSGRDAPAKFLARQKIPKEWQGVTPMGQKTPFTVLNVLGGGLTGGRFVTDCLGVGGKTIEYYTEKDLSIGCTINVYGREIHIIDCDEYTREYYRKKYGLEDFSAVPRPNEISSLRSSVHRSDRVLPAFNGWGSHEDSEGNCKTIEPKPPKIDFKKFIHLDGMKLRFGAKMLSNIRENMERVFIITYYLSDDSVSIYELGTRNSGFLGGEFFKRTKFILPNQEWFTSERPKRFVAQHFYVGATLVLKDFTFHLVTADEFGLSYMEAHPFEYPKSNVETIMQKVRDAVRPCYKDFVAKYLDRLCDSTAAGHNVSIVSFETFREAMLAVLCDAITEHEIITLVRHFSAERKLVNQCERETIRAVVHWELNRKLWDDMARLKEHLYHLDPTTTGFMVAKDLASALMACRLPLSATLMQKMFAVLNKNEDGHIDVCDFLLFIDSVNHKTQPIQPVNFDIDVCPEMPFLQAGRLVDWNCFIAQLGLEEDLKHETD